jgi:carbamoyltransferase
MNILGISEGSHDAAWCLIKDGEIIEAHHIERHTQIKNDKWLQQKLLPKADVVVRHENLNELNKRRKISGQDERKENIKCDVECNHHLSHAWAGWATAPFNDCDILVIDAIGELETAAVYEVRNEKWKLTWTMNYPQSLGLIYSAVTDLLGYKPMEEEYIVMGLAAYGEPNIDLSYLLNENCHKGIKTIPRYPQDVAASVQKLYEDELLKIVKKHCHHKNLILMGGCALNCVANSKINNKNIWIMPNPGDAGSSLGAAAFVYNKKLKWKDPYLGTNIKSNYTPKNIARFLYEHNHCGVADGRIEFGPRALGNRSLLADPRLDIKDSINNIKQRQAFRPFAPAILEEYANEYFEGPMNEYMQFVAKAKHDYKSVTHVDGTARVQIVKKNCKSILRPILEEWMDLTNCPMLLNTSLNVKGKPMVNNEIHKKEWNSGTCARCMVF